MITYGCSTNWPACATDDIFAPSVSVGLHPRGSSDVVLSLLNLLVNSVDTCKENQVASAKAVRYTSVTPCQAVLASDAGVALVKCLIEKSDPVCVSHKKLRAG